jgi:hypothetical protein
MKNDAEANSQSQLRRKRSPHEVHQLFEAARYVPVPMLCLTPEYLQQVGSDGLMFVVSIILAYQQGRYRHKLTDGRLALPDLHLAQWWGFTTTAPVRRARVKVLNAKPPFLSDYREGASGLPSEYQIRRLRETDRVADMPYTCAGMTMRRRPRTDSAEEMSQIALEYVAKSGLSVIPVGPRKTPHVKWKEYQERRASPAEIQQWYRKWPNAGIGIVTGVLSDLVVIDIDGDYEAGLALLRRHGVDLPPTGGVSTGHGVHLWYAHPGGRVPTLAPVVEEGELQIDVRGDGGFAMAPPSIHDNGTEYRFIDTFPRTRPVLPAAFLRLLAQRPKPAAGPGRPNVELAAAAASVLMDVSIVRVIQSCGTDLKQEAVDRFRGICPFHDDTEPSLVVTPSKGLFHCFGCQAAGNAIHFVRKLRGVGFRPALRLVRAV